MANVAISKATAAATSVADAQKDKVYPRVNAIDDLCVLCFPAAASEASLYCHDIEHAELICEEDCKCNHDAIGGGCSFWTKACACGPRNKGRNLDWPDVTSSKYFMALVGKMSDIGYNVMDFLGS